MKNNYTPFNRTIIPSPEFRRFFHHLSLERNRRPAEIEELLDRARTDHQVARLFLADPLGDCLGNV
jgi:hypothetical protein